MDDPSKHQPAQGRDPAFPAASEQFFALFQGLSKAYGTYHIESKTNGTEEPKISGHGVTHKEPPTLEHVTRHLAGTMHLGLVPIREDNTTTWGAIDVDDYNVDINEVARTVSEVDLPLIPCRSKSGGVHLYLFMQSPVLASLLRKKLSEFANDLGWGRSEIFPKQDTIGENDIGNWINLPYQGGSTHSMRYAVAPDGSSMSLDEFFAAVADNIVFPSTLEDTHANIKKEVILDSKSNDLLSEGPPCLNDILKKGRTPPGTRNEVIFNMAIYYRKVVGGDKEKVLELIREANRKWFVPPILDREILSIVRSALKKDYNYRCKEPTLAVCCKKKLCLTRQYGIGEGNTRHELNGAGSHEFLNYGAMTKYQTDPPKWHWDINGEKVELSADDLYNQRAFATKVMGSTVNIVIKKLLSNETWFEIIARHVSEAHVIFPTPEGLPEGRLWAYVQRYCYERPRATAIEEIILGKPFHKENRVYFVPIDLEAYLHQHAIHPKDGQMYIWMLGQGMQPGTSFINGREVRYWSIPEMVRSDREMAEGFDDKLPRAEF